MSIYVNVLSIEKRTESVYDGKGSLICIALYYELLTSKAISFGVC